MTEGVRRVAKSLRREPERRPRHGDTGVLRTAVRTGSPAASEPDVGSGAVLHAVERRFQEALRLEERGAVDVAGVHDRRVALRRLRAALELAGLHGHARRAHALFDALGRVRDRQLRPETSKGAARAAREERAELEELAGEWLSDGAPRLARRLSELVSRGVPPGAVRTRLGRDVRRLEGALEELDPALAPEEVHRARLAARRVRDDLEAVGPDRLQAARGLLPRLVELQEALGALHDHDERVGPARERTAAERLLLIDPARRALRGLLLVVRDLRAELTAPRVQAAGR